MRLRPVQIALLTNMEKLGPQTISVRISSPYWLQQLWDKGWIEPHPPGRFKITDAGRKALKEAEPV